MCEKDKGSLHLLFAVCKYLSFPSGLQTNPTKVSRKVVSSIKVRFVTLEKNFIALNCRTPPKESSENVWAYVTTWRLLRIIVLKSGLEMEVLFRDRCLGQLCAGDTSSAFGPNIPARHMWWSSAFQNNKMWLTKIANVKKEKHMAFQGRQRI